MQKRRQGRPHAIHAPDREEDRGADRRIFDGDQHLVDTRGMWVGDLYPFYHLERIAELCYLKGTHASSLWNGCHLGSN